VSTPPFVDLPERAQRVLLPTGRGPVSGVRIDPTGTSSGTVLFVPGFTGSTEDFIAVLEPMADLGWVVASYDQRGQFRTGGPDDESAYTLSALARDLLDVVGDLGPDPVHVVGHSFGGLVAREAALASGGAAFASLTLLCSGPGPLPQRHHDGLGAMRSALPHVPLETVWEVKDAADREGGWTPPDETVHAFLRHRFLSNNPWGLRAKAGILMDTPDRTDELAALAGSGLAVAVVFGPDDDAWTTSEQEAVAAALGVSPVVIAGTGHSPAAERPGSTAVVLDSVLRRTGS
jgi:pimeloyl-ACP methyl ester carboxylesterase